MKILSTKLAMIGFGMSTLLACGPMRDFHEMHDSTLKMNQTTAEMNTTTAKMAETTQQMAANMATMLKQMTELSTNMKDMRGDIKGMGDKMDVLKIMNDNMTALRGDMAGMASKMDLLKDMNASMNALRGDISTMTSKMDVLKTMNDNMTALRGDMVGMAGKMDLLKVMNANMTALRGDIASMTTKMNVLETMNTNMTALRTDMAGMADKMSFLKVMNESMNALRGDISQMTTMMGVLTEMNQSMKDLRGDIGQMASQMTTMNGSIVIMANQMSGLSGDIKKMGTTLDLTHSDLRLIFTGEHRINTLRAMESATDQTAKMGYAAEYMISQTYQAWNSKIDSAKSRIDLMGIAVPDFFFKIHNYSAGKTSVDPSQTDSQSMNLFAIAAALDYLNVIEVDGIRGSDQKPVTMLSMIEDGLRAAIEVENKKVKLTDLPLYQREVYNHRAEAIYLLQVRHNFLKGVAFTLLSADENGVTQSKAASIWDVFKARVAKINWDADLDSKDIAQLEVIATALDAAAETEKFLLETGHKLKIYANISALLRKIDVSALESRASAPEVEHFNRALSLVGDLDQK